MKLKSFAPNKENPEKVDFVFTRDNKEDLILTLKEKSNWPLIWGQDISKVEKWILNYLIDLRILIDFDNLKLPKDNLT